MTLQDKLKTLRQETGFSQKEFAQKYKIEVSKYNKWENGKYSPGYEELCRLAKIFNVTTDFLLDMPETNTRIIEVKADLSAYSDVELLKEIERRMRGEK